MNDGDKSVSRTRQVFIGLCVIATCAILVAVVIQRTRPASAGRSKPVIVSQQVSTKDRPIAVPENGYVGSESCRECHEHNYETWYDSYHRTMTQVASTQTTAASFDDVDIEFADPATKKVTLRQDGDQLWVEQEEVNAAGQSQIMRRPIVLLTGSHHSQGYWFASGQGRALERFPFTYRIDQQRWITDVANFLRPAGDPNVFAVVGAWNYMCERCHTTRPQPRFEGDSHYDTHVTDFGIACEACHGAGAEHIQNAGLGLDDLAIVQPEKLSPRRSSEVCGQCHSAVDFKTKEDYTNWMRDGFSFQPGDALEEHLRIKKSDVHTFWNDGMVRISGREYNGLLDTPCFTHDNPAQQMTCMSCHVMHQPADDPRSRKEWANDQLKYNMDSNRPGLHNNQACTQCHEEYADETFLTDHTHHDASSSGSVCYNCHMPHTTWGLMKAIRSHTISSPHVRESMDPVGRPNACNSCHLDKTLFWTADALNRQYGQPIPELSEEQKEIATGVLWALKGDAAQRALTAWAMGWKPAQETAGVYWMVPILSRLLIDPYDAVRNIAYLSLRTIDAYQDFNYDFLGPGKQRQAALQQALEIWNLQRQEQQWGGSDALLLDESGRLKEAELQRLLRWRDDRDIFIAE